MPNHTVREPGSRSNKLETTEAANSFWCFAGTTSSGGPSPHPSVSHEGGVFWVMAAVGTVSGQRGVWLKGARCFLQRDQSLSVPSSYLLIVAAAQKSGVNWMFTEICVFHLFVACRGVSSPTTVVAMHIRGKTDTPIRRSSFRVDLWVTFQVSHSASPRIHRSIP